MSGHERCRLRRQAAMPPADTVTDSDEGAWTVLPPYDDGIDWASYNPDAWRSDADIAAADAAYQAARLALADAYIAADDHLFLHGWVAPSLEVEVHCLRVECVRLAAETGRIIP